MSTLRTDPSSRTAPPAPPELPEGWHYAEELDYKDPYLAPRWRRLRLPVLIGVLVMLGAIGLVALNAERHYSRGVTALDGRSYSQAAAEFSSAKLLVIPYRDAQVLAERARRELAKQTADEAGVRQRVDAVTGTLDDAAARLDAGDSRGVLAALQALRRSDVQAALRASAGARDAAGALTRDLTAAAEEALGRLKWARAGRFAAALLVLRPSSAKAEALAGKAGTGEELSARLAKARDAAHRGLWRRALRLALAVTAVREGFPGAAAVIADARKALAPKPAAPAVTTTTTPAATSGGTSSGSSSPPPPPPP